ncbi:MAG: clostripain-related cysteine peptidase [Bacteroidales bacterium]|nr:clostripain-related cysteine peptidase [Bacteroidales bacterium]
MKTRGLAIVLLAAAMAVACSDPLPMQEESQQKFSRVLIYVGEGNNSLSNYIIDDINDMIGDSSNPLLPAEGCNRAFIVISHLPRARGDYATATATTITRVSRDYLGRPIRDTLMRMPAGTILTKAENMSSALEFVHSEFPSDSYGLILSSHGTGWLPAGYYDSENGGSSLAARARRPEGAVPYVERPSPDGIDVKTFGQEIVNVNGQLWSYEMSLPTLAAAFPFKFDYMIMDACLMGGIETAYELRNATRYLCFSQTEILADGLPYKTLLGPLFKETPANIQNVCEEYYDMYAEKTGTYQSATISMIDCTKLDLLAECCKDLFSRYRDAMNVIDRKNVQGFFRFDKHWFYDLEDILTNAGMSVADQKALSTALKECVIYKAHTPSFMEDFEIKKNCGLSMYLPVAGNSYLDSYYTGLEWNKATGLVE